MSTTWKVGSEQTADRRGKGGGQKLAAEDRAEVKVHFHIPLSAPFEGRHANYTKERVQADIQKV